MRRLPLKSAIAAALMMSVTSFAHAEDDSVLDIGRIAIGGYGDVQYVNTDTANDTFKARFVPIFLFQLSEKIHVESELEFSYSETGETTTELEYADLHYFLNDNTTITAGKFLLPFAQLGPNLHPSWINKLATVPGIYGHDGNGSLTPLIPILSDVGFSVQNTFKVGGSARLFTDFYIVNGPKLESDLTGITDAGGEEPPFPEVVFEANNGDNNDNKAFGGRVALAFLPQWEVGYSFYNGAYDTTGKLDFSISAVDVTWNGTYTSIRGEYISTTTQGIEELTNEKVDFDRDGIYLQGSWSLRQFGNEMLNPVELVLRYSEVNKIEGGKRWTMGINYWLESSAALKFSYEDTKLDNGSKDNRLFVQLAFGF